MNNEKKPDLLFKAVGWDVGPLPENGLITFRPIIHDEVIHFLTESESSPTYALTATQAHELIAHIQMALRSLENAVVGQAPEMNQ